jgi:hypothetical protein
MVKKIIPVCSLLISLLIGSAFSQTDQMTTINNLKITSIKVLSSVRASSTGAFATITVQNSAWQLTLRIRCDDTNAKSILAQAISAFNNGHFVNVFCLDPNYVSTPQNLYELTELLTQ